MSRVTITLEDNAEGTVNQTVAYEMVDGEGAAHAGFDKHSPAHMYSVMMLKAGSDIAKEQVSAANDGSAGLILLA